MKKYTPFIIASIVVFLLWGTNWFLLRNASPDDRGTFGDMFGVVNSLFTGLSFAGIIYAMYLQNKELSLQRKELRDTRVVMKEQSDTIKVQTAESTFFRLLENHRSLVSSLSFSSGKNGYEGLNEFYNTLKRETTEYYQVAMLGEVKNIAVTANYPIRKLKYQIENVEQIYSNSLHLINFISSKLSSEVFYHQTFYNSLSKAEKYILGLYVVNKPSEHISNFQNGNFNYLEYFEGSGNAYFNNQKVPFIPELSFNFVRGYYKIDNNEIGDLEIKIVNNEKNSLIKLVETKFEYNWMGEKHDIKSHWNVTIKIDEIISLKDLIKENITNNFKAEFQGILDERYNQFPFPFKIDFVFDIDNRIVTYIKNFKTEFYNINSPHVGISLSIQDN